MVIRHGLRIIAFGLAVDYVQWRVMLVGPLPDDRHNIASLLVHKDLVALVDNADFLGSYFREGAAKQMRVIQAYIGNSADFIGTIGDVSGVVQAADTGFNYGVIDIAASQDPERESVEQFEIRRLLPCPF